MLTVLDENDLKFPDPIQALTNPNGLLAVGGDLSSARLLKAYQQGIFPWFDSDEDSILWWHPDPRCILYPNKLHLSRSLKKSIRNKNFTFTKNKAFLDVIHTCAKTRADTWITESMITAYTALHEQGYAHSYEIWQNGLLCGGLYGIQVNTVFCGESMFSTKTDSSKVALYYLCQDETISLIDCQIENPHLLSLGAELISRQHFLKALEIKKE